MQRSDAASQPMAAVVLRFAGTHWLAVDHSHHGLYLDGARMSTIDIRDGQTIAIGDPQRGPWLRFEVTAPTDAPAPSTDPLGVRMPPPPEAEPPTGRIETEPQTTRMSAVPVSAPPPVPAPPVPAPPVPAPPADGDPAPWRIPSTPVKPPEPVQPAEPLKPA